MDRKAELEALHGHLTGALADAKPSEVASLSKEMRAVVAELLSIKPEQVGEVTALEKARAKRAGLPGAADSQPARRRSQSRRSGSNHRAG